MLRNGDLEIATVDNLRHLIEILRQLWLLPRTNNALTCGFERVRRIELPSSAWEAEVLPLNYTRKSCFNKSTVRQAIL